MATWKKIIVSGSAASLASINADGTVSASIFSASMGFHGDGSGLTNISAETASYVSGTNVDGAVASANTASYVAASNIDGGITASYVETSSIVNFNTEVSRSAVLAGFGGGGLDSMDTGSFYISSSVADATVTFTQGDGTTESVTVNNVATANTASYVDGANVNGAVADATSASFATTASYVDISLVTEGTGIASGSAQIVSLLNGQNVTLGEVNATSITTEIVSSSILLTTGSNVFGDETSDTHEFTGSVGFQGNVVAQNAITASGFSGDGSGLTNITADSANTASYVESSNVDGPLGFNSVASASQALTASYVGEDVLNSSITGTAGTLAKFATGGGVEDSLLSDNNQNLTFLGSGSTFLSSSLTVDRGFEVLGSTTTIGPNNTGGSVALRGDSINLTGGASGIIINATLGGTNRVGGAPGFGGGSRLEVDGSANGNVHLTAEGTGEVQVSAAAVTDGTDAAPNILAVGTDGRLQTANVTASMATTASYAVTASYALNVQDVDISATSASYINDGVVVGTANEITVASSSGQLTIGLPDDVVIAGNLTVQGTQTSLNVTNLDVEDRFITLNSGSAAGDAGIVFNQGGNVGPALGYDQSATRLGYQLNLSGSATAIAPDAFVTLTSEGGSGEDAPADASLDSAVEQKGSIFVGDNGDIYIYS